MSGMFGGRPPQVPLLANPSQDVVDVTRPCFAATTFDEIYCFKDACIEETAQLFQDGCLQGLLTLRVGLVGDEPDDLP